MQKKSSAHYQREYRNRLREQGLVKKEVWILPENARRLAMFELELRVSAKQVVSSGLLPAKGESRMTDVVNRWTTASLYDALTKADMFTAKRADLELIDGVSPALHIIMYEYGDLPLFLTVSGEQIVVEAMLWSVSEVNNPSLFNETVLRTHKYFPLSNISLDKMDGDDCYHMFGALSSASSLQDVILEIEMLASNVIQATEAYSEFLIS
ncbi:MAG: YjfI family protein [Cellvibrio sp.]|uniref:YjfI family protein n=1 Tax=Cellvibrio sp. TaxID=1965322 RepID=UPI00271D7741|nr:YjfI family protein [Cellvibrio sp.]